MTIVFVIHPTIIKMADTPNSNSTQKLNSGFQTEKQKCWSRTIAMAIIIGMQTIKWYDMVSKSSKNYTPYINLMNSMMDKKKIANHIFFEKIRQFAWNIKPYFLGQISKM